MRHSKLRFWHVVTILVGRSNEMLGGGWLNVHSIVGVKITVVLNLVLHLLNGSAFLNFLV